MGILGLLKGLQVYSKQGNLTAFSDQSLAIDASGWLHKSVYSISERYVESTERSKTTIDPQCLRVATSYMVKRCQEMLTHARISKIYLVFDGTRCPMKAGTNDEREERRTSNLKEARRFQRQGQRIKAEDRYKMCIKIHEAFANAVAANMRTHFRNDSRFHILQSPYEADAQMMKLCLDGLCHAIVTEDSDVLVYSAACQISVPILYKLDRSTGMCIVYSMDWLLGHNKENQSSVPNTKPGALESVLSSLVDRQIKRPGLGVRLFVQACVLTGSDYSPNKLNGIGLVSAFKLVRDNAHRPCHERFARILKTISKKNRGNEDLVAYEKMLAQSEAVFYLHPVLGMGGKQTITLTIPRLTKKEEEEDDFSPLLDRFNSDYSFLGDVDLHASRFDVPNDRDDIRRDMVEVSTVTPFPVREIVIKEPPLKRLRQHDHDGENEVRLVMRSIQNPYKKTTALTNDDNMKNNAEKKENAKKDKVGANNPFAKFAHKKTNTFVDARSDLRFTKRRFDKLGKAIPLYKKGETLKIVTLPSPDTHQQPMCGIPVEQVDSSEQNDPTGNRQQFVADDTWNEGEESSYQSFPYELREGPMTIDTSQYRESSRDESFPREIGEAPTMLTTSQPREPTNDESFLRPQEITQENDVPLESIHSSSFYKSSSVSKSVPSDPLLSPANDSFEQRISRPEISSMREALDLSEEDDEHSKFFARPASNARRVTLDSPQPSLLEFQNVGRHSNRGRSIMASPGEDSEVEEFQASALGYQSRANATRDSVVDEIDLISGTSLQNKSKSSQFGKSFSSHSTPFQTNFNAVYRDSRPSCTKPRKRGQPTLIDSWGNQSQTSTSSSDRWSSRTRSKRQPSKNQITSYFGYSSLGAETDDGDFMGL